LHGTNLSKSPLVKVRRALERKIGVEGVSQAQMCRRQRCDPSSDYYSWSGQRHSVREAPTEPHGTLRRLCNRLGRPWRRFAYAEDGVSKRTSAEARVCWEIMRGASSQAGNRAANNPRLV
jgi:hypothetical protein